jgi:hypothetical protein
MFLCYEIDFSVTLGCEMKRGYTGCMSCVLYIARLSLSLSLSLYIYIYMCVCVVIINKTNAER